MTIGRFRRIVRAHYKKHGRHDLPWRQTRDPYPILVSEVMLQQTQVERVIPFYTRFIKRFPTAKKLAEAPLADALKAWQGLGYNRRAKLLREAAQGLAHTPLSATRFDLVKRLEALPGVGPYTARAVAAFAFNKDVVLVETNIRTAVTHHFFQNKRNISDTQIKGILAKAFPRGKAREWYSALMDYGAWLKKSGIRLNAHSRHYARQSKFAGSPREARGAILRTHLARKPLATVRNRFPGNFQAALTALRREGLITSRSGRG